MTSSQDNPRFGMAPPGSAEVLDTVLVDRAVDRIKKMTSRTDVQGLSEVGQYLFKEFFGGDIDAYRSADPGRHASLRGLQARCETLDPPVSRSFLTRALGVAALELTLPPGSPFLQLPASHRVELLGVRDPVEVERLAGMAVEGRLSVHKLRALVRREVKRTASTRGPKPVPAVVRVLRHLHRSIRGCNGHVLSESEKLTGEHRAEASLLLVEAARWLRKLSALLEVELDTHCDVAKRG